MKSLETLRRNVKRARTVHEREQERGRRDMSCQQTRRMALAVAALQRAHGALARELTSHRLLENLIPRYTGRP